MSALASNSHLYINYILIIYISEVAGLYKFTISNFNDVCLELCTIESLYF